MSQDQSDSEFSVNSEPKQKSFVLIREDPSQEQKLSGKRAVARRVGIKVVENENENELEMYKMKKDAQDLEDNFFEAKGVDSGLNARTVDKRGEKGQRLDLDLTVINHITSNGDTSNADSDMSQDFILLRSIIQNSDTDSGSSDFFISKDTVQEDDYRKGHGARVRTDIGRNGTQEYVFVGPVTEERTKFFNLPESPNQIQNFVGEQTFGDLKTKTILNRSLKLQKQNSNLGNSDLNNLNQMRLTKGESARISEKPKPINAMRDISKIEFMFSKKQSVTDIQISSRLEDNLTSKKGANFESDFDSLSAINSGALTLQNTGFEHLSNPFLGLPEKQTIDANYGFLSQDSKSQSSGLRRNESMNLEQLVDQSIGNCQFSNGPQNEIFEEKLSCEGQSKGIVADANRRFSFLN